MTGGFPLRDQQRTNIKSLFIYLLIDWLIDSLCWSHIKSNRGKCDFRSRHPEGVPGPDITVPSVALFIGTPSPGKVLYIGTEKGCISIAVIIILLTLSCYIQQYWRGAPEFQHHGQRESSRWKARSLSMVLDRARQQHSAAEPPDICSRWHVYISPITWISPGQSKPFFLLFTSPCARITFSCGPRSKKEKKKENRQLLQWNATQFMVLLKRRGKWTEKAAGGRGGSPHAGKKCESLSSHRLQLYFKPEAHTVWPTQLYHMHIAISVKGPLNESTNTRVECFSLYFFFFNV